MAQNNSFTPEQVEMLLSNPYTFDATESYISFTKEFKEFFYQKLLEKKFTTKEIIKLAGYDPEWFGSSRLDRIRQSIRKEAVSEEGFTNPKRRLSHEDKKKRADEEAAKAKDSEAKIKLLQDRIDHLEAQIEFLKKTALIRKKYQKSED